MGEAGSIEWDRSTVCPMYPRNTQLGPGPVHLDQVTGLGAGPVIVRLARMGR